MTTSLLPFDHTPADQQVLWNTPRARTLIELLEVPAALAPEALAFGLAHHGADPQAVSWRELWRSSRSRAAHWCRRVWAAETASC